MSRPTSKLLNRVFVTLAWLVALLAFAVLTATVIVPKVMGWVPLTILSGSMEPTYPVGSQVIVSRVHGNAEASKLNVGDVISFLPRPADPTMVTHRIVKKSVRADGVTVFNTRGDANNADDPWQLTSKQIRAKVRYHVPFVGYAAKSMGQDKKDIGIWIAAAGLFGFALWQILGAFVKPKRDPKAETTRAKRKAAA